MARFRNTTTPISIEAAQSDYDASAETLSSTPVPSVSSTTDDSDTSLSSPPSASSPSTQPPGSVELAAPGVYRMTTTGRESIDVLGGASHEYPAETPLVVRRSGCGVRVEWTPLVERTEWWEMCLVDGGIALVRYGGIHEFFGQRDEHTVECPDRSWLIPPPQTATTWEQTCSGSGLVEVRRFTIGAPVTVTVAGAPMRALRVDMTSSTSGAVDSAGTRSLLLTENGLPLSWSENALGSSDTVAGTAVYRETLELVLVSTSPA
jgi:hypothetical protein